MGKRQEAMKETHARLLQALRELGEEKSYNDISIEEVTSRAGVAKGTFYTHFKRMEDAVCEISYESFEKIQAELTRSRKSPLRQLSDYLAKSTATVSRNGLNITQQWMKSACAPISEEARTKEILAADTAFIRSRLCAAVDAGELTDSAPLDTLANEITAQYYGIIALWCIDCGKTDIKRLMQHFCADGLEATLEKYRNRNENETAEAEEEEK